MRVLSPRAEREAAGEEQKSAKRNQTPGSQKFA
jgi:hypothetical protein